MGIFSGFGKKSKDSTQNAPKFDKPPEPRPSTLHEAGKSTFEVPDFTENDLDFDLGLDEFAPQELTNVPKGPSSQEVLPEVEYSKEDESFKKNKEPLPLPAIPVEVEKATVQADPEPEIFPYEVTEKQREEELPTFEMRSNSNSDNVNSFAEEREEISPKPLRKKSATPPEFFMEKQQYMGMLLATDTVMKESSFSGTQGKNLEELFRKQDKAIFDFKRNVDYIKSRLLAIDEELFGEG